MLSGRCRFYLTMLCVFACTVLAPNLRAAAQSPAAVPFAAGERVLFLGDSITQDGRYVDLVTGYLWAAYPERPITVINAGLSSETVSGITEPIHPYPRPNVLDRIDRALRLADPDWVIVCYGMNDGIYHPSEPRIREAYQQGLGQVLAKIEGAGARAILLSPPVFDAEAPNVVQRLSEAPEAEPFGYRKPYEQYDQSLAKLSEIVQSFASDPRVARVVDVHSATAEFLRAAKEADPGFVYGDGVHPPLEGHAAMAAGLLRGLGEDASRVDHTLARITGIRPPGAEPETLPAAENAPRILDALLVRGRELSAAYRRAIDPKTPSAEAQPIVDPAREIADAREAEIRELILQAMKS